MDMGSLRAELQLPHHFITGDEADDLDDDIMILGSTPQVCLSVCSICESAMTHWTAAAEIAGQLPCAVAPKAIF